MYSSISRFAGFTNKPWSVEVTIPVLTAAMMMDSFSGNPGNPGSNTNNDPRVLIASIRTVSPDDEKYTYSTIPRHTNGRVNHSYLLDNRFALGADFVAQYSAIIHICMAEVPDSPLSIRFTYCIIKQRTLVISYEIWLREGLLHQQMQQRGTFKQEYDWLVLFSKVHSLMTPTVCVNVTAGVTPGITPTTAPLKIPYWKMARYPLYPHQVESLLWMEQLEARVLSGEASYSVTSSDTVRLGASKYIFRRGSPARFELISGGSTHTTTTPGSIFYHGGLLADATGTGKTAITLALILRQQQNKRGGAAPPATPSYPKNAWFVARGTLIITPVNLARQWSCEIQKFLQPQHPLKIIEILDQRHAKNLSLDDLEAADIVITTRAHLKHIEYIRKCNQQWAAVCDSIPDHYKNASSWPPLSIIDMGTRAAFHQNQRWRGYVPLNSLYWRRIIVDEAHEEHPSSNFLCGLRALVWFGLTGTPEPLMSDLYTQLLLVGGGGAGAGGANNLNLNPTQPFLDLCIQRHKNIAFPEQFSIQQHVHKIQLEPSHDAEYRQLQDDVTEAESEEALIKCGVLWHGPMVTTPPFVPLMPRDGILKTMHAAYDAQAHTLQRSQHQFRDNPQEVARLAELRDKLTRQHEYFATSALSPNFSVCPICYDQTAFCLLLCGHWFCDTCVCECHVCAMCKEPTTKNMFQVDTDHTRGEYFQRMGKQYGEKFRVILETLYEIVLQKREKAVVFIQFTKILSQFHRILELTIPGIRVAKLIGNTSSRAAVIDCFVNQQTVDVLFLPMELSNSGLNLTMANHVLYVHPMLNAAPAISLRTHEQCLGRVIRPTQTRNVTVHYFIIQNSIEEEALKNLLGRVISATTTTNP